MLGQLGQGDVIDVTPPSPGSGKTGFGDVESLKKQPFVQPGAPQK
jgi:hypothetical protein